MDGYSPGQTVGRNVGVQLLQMDWMRLKGFNRCMRELFRKVDDRATNVGAQIHNPLDSLQGNRRPVRLKQENLGSSPGIHRWRESQHQFFSGAQDDGFCALSKKASPPNQVWQSAAP